MAGLDDFFAKKDRKNTKRKKFVTTDDIAKNLEDGGKRLEKMKREKLLSSKWLDCGHFSGNYDEDEWKDFVEEKKDYTGLKIQNLIMIKNESGYGYIDGEMEENENGELVPKRKVQVGPWKLVSQPQAPSLEELDVKSEDDIITDRGGKTSYIPPHIRNLAKKPSFHLSLTNVKNKSAPDVNSEGHFPTLSATKNNELAYGSTSRRKREDSSGFEKVYNSKSHTSRFSETSIKETSSGKLVLGNKYSALERDES